MAQLRLALLAKDRVIDETTGRLISIVGLIDASVPAFDRVPAEESVWLIFWCTGDAGEALAIATTFHAPDGTTWRDPDMSLTFEQPNQLGCCIVGVDIAFAEPGVHRLLLLFNDAPVWEGRILVGSEPPQTIVTLQ